MENKGIFIDDTPVDLSMYTDEELEQMFQERFGEYLGN